MANDGIGRRSFLGLLFGGAAAAALPTIAALESVAAPAVAPAKAGLGRGVHLVGRMVSGEPAIVWFQDLGDCIPGFDNHGNRFEAYSTRIEVNGVVGYSQVDREIAHMSGDLNRFRECEDTATLESAGVDVSSLKLVDELAA